MNKIIFISDFFVNEILGGGEKSNDAFLKKIRKKYSVETIKSEFVTEEFLKERINSFVIVANFFLLSEKNKNFIKDSMSYLIYEHDHKYVKTNNPSIFNNYEIPVEYLINLDFYSKAKAVLCQSKLHSDILYKNTLLQNIINLGGNFWDDEDIKLLEENVNTEKTIEYAILNSANKNKGRQAAVEYCKNNNINFYPIDHQEYSSFLKKLSSTKTLIFFPQWIETYNRVSIEAKILGCKLITNKFIGAASEDYFCLKGKELLEKIKLNNNLLLEKIVSVINDENKDFYIPFKIPKLTFITSLYKGEKYIDSFLKNITEAYLFDKTELLIYDSASPENEYFFIKPYLEKYKNIVYKRLDKNYTPAEVVNMGIRESTGIYLSTSPVDDRIGKNYIRLLLKTIIESNDQTCLIYGDCLETTNDNETLEKNSSNGKLYEHSLNNFSKENMIKSLPGPMPIWKKEVHEKIGYFREDIKYPIDWEMWLRMVKNGYVFKKINLPVGLYLMNQNGLTTSNENSNIKHREEARIFFEYKEIFGNNFEKYKHYFNNFLLKEQNDN